MKSNLQLRTRLSLLVLYGIVPLFLVCVASAVLTARNDTEQAAKNLEFSAVVVAANQQRVADSARRLLAAIGYVPELAEANEAFCQRYFNALLADLQIYANVGILGTDGYVRCSAEPNTTKQFRGDRAYFKSAMASGDFVASGLIESRINGKAIVAFALPLKAGDGSVKAVAFASMYTTDVANNMTSFSLPPGGQIVIMDREGVVLASSSNKLAEPGKPIPLATVRNAIKAGIASVFEGVDAAGAPHLYAFRPSSLLPNSPFFVLVSTPKSEVLGPARQQFLISFMALLLSALFGLWISWRLVGQEILRAMMKVLDATSRVQAGELSVRLPVRPNAEATEYSRIATSFNSMAETLQQREHERAKNYAELYRTQSQLLAAQKLGRIGNWELDMTTNRLSWSAEVDGLFGLQPGEFDGERSTFLKMLHPDDLDRYEEQRKADDLNAAQGEIEYRIITPAGDVRWMLQLGKVEFDDAGRPVLRSGVVQDITLLHKSREHLLLLEAAIGRINDIVLITEAEPVSEPGPRIVFVNDAFERQTGYSQKEAVGQTPRILQGPNTQQSELDRISQALQAWESVKVEVINYTKAGKEYWVEFEIVPIANAKGWFTHLVSVQRDITERKLAEAALIASEQRYAALFEMAPVPMWVYSATDYRFLNVNRTAVENYGYSEEEFLSMTLFDIRDASNHNALRNRLLGLIDSRPIWQHKRKDGSFLMVNVVSKPIQYAGQSANFVVALDVTATLNAEKGVQAQILTLRRAADAAQAITWQQTVEGMLQETADQARYVIEAHQCRITLTPDADSPVMSNALSLSEKYAVHRGAQDVFDGSGLYTALSDTNGIVRMTQAELEAHPGWRDFQKHAEISPPLRGWLAVPLTGRQGQNIGLLHLSDKQNGDFILQDEYVALELAQLASIALENARLLEQVYQLNTGLEQKVAERTLALTRQEALFRALAEQAPQVIWTADSQGKTNYLNRAWFDLVGGTPEDWQGTRWSSVIHPEDLPQIREKWAHSVANRSPFIGTRRLRGRHGNYHVMSYRALPVLDEQGAVSFWVGIDADITELKDVESALRLSNQELEAFSYSVSHDLRSPLNTIDGFSRLLGKSLANHVDTKAQHYLSRIQTGVAQMGQLIEELLLLAQVSRTELRPVQVDLSDLSQSILTEWHVRDPNRQVAIHIEPGLDVQGDVSLIRVLMENLLGNAWKFTSQRAVANITVGRQYDAHGLPVFFVRDDGAGFDMAYANKLFVAFQRLHLASEFPGSGVGLATVSRVISRHGGQIWADALPDQGATFFFTLPQTPVSL